MTPLTPLDTFRSVMGYHPWHFWQLENETIPLVTNCDDLVRQFSWQYTQIENNKPGASRSDLSQAMEHAESRMAEYLEFDIAPRFREETVKIPRWFDVTSSNLSYSDAAGRWLPIQLEAGKIISIGAETRTLIGTPTVTFSDSDGDGLDDTFTIFIATTVTDVNQIAVYFAATDRLDTDPVSETYRVLPVKISISGGTVTITGKKWLITKPVLYERVSTDGLDPDTAGNFPTTLDVYRKFIDPDGVTPTTAQAELIWESPPWPQWCSVNITTNFGDDRLDPAATASAIGRVTLRDARLGIVALGEAVFNTTTSQWNSVRMSEGRPPDRVIVRYSAGDTSNWDVTTCRLAAAELGRGLTACRNAESEIYKWQQDVSRNDPEREVFEVAEQDLENPFGTRRGHIQAWHRVKQLLKVEPVLS